MVLLGMQRSVEVLRFLDADSYEMEKELETAGQDYGAHVVWFCS